MYYVIAICNDSSVITLLVGTYIPTISSVPVSNIFPDQYYSWCTYLEPMVVYYLYNI